MAFRPRSDDPQEATHRLVTDADRAPLPVWIRVVSARSKPSHFRLARGSCVLGAGTAAVTTASAFGKKMKNVTPPKKK